MACRDEAGFIRLVDRKSNMIISGGENIYPSEVETLVGGHPMVKDVAVIGVPDQKWGERVHAVVVPHDGAPIDEATLQDWGAHAYRRLQMPEILCLHRRDRNAAKRDRQGAAS